jgi:uncharacterized membrane protein YkgB
LLVFSAWVGFRSGLLRFGTGAATASDIAGPRSAAFAAGGAIVPVGIGIVHLKD